MKNIQVIDGANNSAYDVFGISEVGYTLMFSSGTDVEFVDDFIERVGKSQADEILNGMWENRLNKKVICGIHGTLFFQLDHKKEFYPIKNESELIT
jgi:hypothetical protein